MAKNSIRDYDNTSGNNTDIQSVDISEGCSPAGINNAIREVMADLADVNDGTVALTSPSADSMTVTGDLTVDTSTLKVDSTNNRVGIGTTSPTASLDIPTGGIRVNSSGADTNSKIGNFGVGGFEGYIEPYDSNAFTNIVNTVSSKGITFQTSGSERMRIDSSGNVLVGTTDSNIASASGGSNEGIKLDGPQGQLQVTSVSDAQMYLNRQSTDGDIAVFRKDGTTVGSISTNGSRLQIGQGSAQLFFDDGSSKAIWPADTSGGTDNVLDLGDSSKRFDDIYATNGTIQTSDQNEKQQIASLTDAEITAAKAISKLFKTFKWNDKVEEKGDAARTHTGVISQDVQQAMTDTGLDAGDYAFFISTTWWETQTEVPAVEADEENGIEAADAYTRTDTYDTAEEAPEGATERTRLGIRYPELLAFIGAATEQRLADIETRLTALEAN